MRGWRNLAGARLVTLSLVDKVKTTWLLSRRELLMLVGALPLGAASGERLRVGHARFRVERHGRAGEGVAARSYLHIHGNEITARAVLASHMASRAGVAVFVEGSTRAVSLEGLLIDPNRMFSREGAEASLRRLNPRAKEPSIARALARLQRDLPRLLSAMLPAPGGLLISMHNNSQGYNIREEIPMSERHHLPVPDEPHNFYLATDSRDFQRIAGGPYNAVLQMKPPSPDDGSLSRLCAARNIRYVNLEAKLGEAVRQREMLTWLEDALPAAYPE